MFTMFMDHKQLIGLVVTTPDRKKLGKVIGFRFDPESQSILQYDVSRGLFGGEPLVVHRSQVLAITAESMVVDELKISEGAEQENKARMNAPVGTTAQLSQDIE